MALVRIDWDRVEAITQKGNRVARWSKERLPNLNGGAVRLKFTVYNRRMVDAMRRMEAKRGARRRIACVTTLTGDMYVGYRRRT